MEDVFATPGVVILEWPDRFQLQTAWPQVHISLEHLGGDTRRIVVTSTPEHRAATGSGPLPHV